MTPSKEDGPHELYLRTSSAAKPNMPLKLNAIITGKFMVDREELVPKVQDKVRDSTKKAERERTERKTLILENAPPQPKASKNAKKAKPAPTRRAVTVEARRNISTTVPARPPPRVPSPTRSSLVERDPDIRRRIILCLALRSRTAKDVARLVVHQDGVDEPTLKEVTGVLEEVR